jgi:septum formation protein
VTRPLLILASTSRYRRELLGRLRLPFEAIAPEVDETAMPGETPAPMAARLALAKACAVAALQPGAVVIGSDQVCDLDGQALGKPGDHANATRQLRLLSGRTALFHTAVAVVQPSTGFQQTAMSAVRVRFRALTDQDIARYLHLDQPYDCAGSAKCETLGITLLESIESDDPTALIGLPLIHTARLLRLAGIDPLAP